MTASDFEVRENGTVRPHELLPTTEPLRVALIVSQTSRSHRLIPAAHAFCESFEGNGEVSVTAVMDEAEVMSSAVLRAGSERPTPLYGERLRDPTRASGAVLYAASTPEAERQLTASRGLAMSTIVDSAIDSGGRHVLIGADDR